MRGVFVPSLWHAALVDTHTHTHTHLCALSEQHTDNASYTDEAPRAWRVCAAHAGRLSMARGASEDSGSSSIFICYGDAPHLDMQYGIFGQITRGMNVLHKASDSGLGS